MSGDADGVSVTVPRSPIHRRAASRALATRVETRWRPPRRKEAGRTGSATSPLARAAAAAACLCVRVRRASVTSASSASSAAARLSRATKKPPVSPSCGKKTRAPAPSASLGLPSAASLGGHMLGARAGIPAFSASSYVSYHLSATSSASSESESEPAPSESESNLPSPSPRAPSPPANACSHTPPRPHPFPSPHLLQPRVVHEPVHDLEPLPAPAREARTRRRPRPPPGSTRRCCIENTLPVASTPPLWTRSRAASDAARSLSRGASVEGRPGLCGACRRRCKGRPRARRRIRAAVATSTSTRKSTRRRRRRRRRGSTSRGPRTSAPGDPAPSRT